MLAKCVEYSITSTTSASIATPETPSAMENDVAGPSALEEASRGCRPVALTSHIMKAKETLHKLHLLHVFICHYYTYRHVHSSSLLCSLYFSMLLQVLDHLFSRMIHLKYPAVFSFFGFCVSSPEELLTSLRQTTNTKPLSPKRWSDEKAYNAQTH